jgi:hypothetical protein
LGRFRFLFINRDSLIDECECNRLVKAIIFHEL